MSLHHHSCGRLRAPKRVSACLVLKNSQSILIGKVFESCIESKTDCPHEVTFKGAWNTQEGVLLLCDFVSPLRNGLWGWSHIFPVLPVFIHSKKWLSGPQSLLGWQACVQAEPAHQKNDTLEPEAWVSSKLPHTLYDLRQLADPSLPCVVR